MSAARLTILVLGSALVTAWLVSGAATRRREGSGPPADAAVPQPVRSALARQDLELRTEALAARRERLPPLRRSPRNPFRFGERAPELPTGRRGEVDAASGVSPEVFRRDAVEPGAPRLRLVAIAEDRTREGPVRLAALAVGDAVVLARVGDEVDGRFVVTAISSDVVELHDRRGGVPVRLALR